MLCGIHLPFTPFHNEKDAECKTLHRSRTRAGSRLPLFCRADRGGSEAHRIRTESGRWAGGGVRGGIARETGGIEPAVVEGAAFRGRARSRRAGRRRRAVWLVPH